jgi:hypothetical protein
MCSIGTVILEIPELLGTTPAQQIATRIALLAVNVKIREGKSLRPFEDRYPHELRKTIREAIDRWEALAKVLRWNRRGPRGVGDRPEDEPIVALVQKLRDEGRGLTYIAQQLNEKGFKTPQGKMFRAQQVSNILRRLKAKPKPPKPQVDKSSDRLSYLMRVAWSGPKTSPR